MKTMSRKKIIDEFSSIPNRQKRYYLRHRDERKKYEVNYNLKNRIRESEKRKKEYREKDEVRLAHIENAMNWQKKNPEKEQIIRLKSRLKTYRITIFEYMSLLKLQDNKCAICGKVMNGYHEPFVDHDHKTDKVRGLLCYHCNVILGHAYDNSEILRKAIEYLREKKI